LIRRLLPAFYILKDFLYFSGDLPQVEWFLNKPVATFLHDGFGLPADSFSD
jgi:hypothetical protein